MSRASIRVTRSSDGQMLFLAEKLSEMKRGPGATMMLKRKKLLVDSLDERDESAATVVKKVPTVVKKVHRRATTAEPIRDLYEVRDGVWKLVMEYEPDSGLRDTEQIPLQEEGGIRGFLLREVLPYAPEDWYVPKSVKTGYEISFNRYFYKSEPMRTLEETRANIVAVERETEGLLTQILGENVR